MADPLGGPPTNFSSSPYMHPFRPASIMNANRFDEGYSEDTRSQNETDMVMGAGDSGMEPDAQQFSLPDWILGLDEQQRSGMSRMGAHRKGSADTDQRNRVLHSAIATNLLNSQHRREIKPTSASRPCDTPSARNHLPDPLIPRT